MRQIARRRGDEMIVATAEFVFVCIDREGKPMPVPDTVGSYLGDQPSNLGTVRRVTVNGVSLAVEIEGDGPSILFIHGYPLDRSIWRHQIGALVGWRRIAPDLRGFGDSDAPDLGYSMSTYAADLAALLDAIGVERVVLCGLSMGGYIAFEFLRAYRHRVQGLALISTRAQADSAEGRRARDSSAATARERGAAAIADMMMPRMLAADASLVGSEPADGVRAIMAAAPVSGIVGALTAMRDRADSTSLLPTLTDLPTLVLAGESDQLIPLPDVTRMSDAIPAAVLRVVPKAGHLPPVEQPLITTQIIQEFLDSLPGR